MVDRLDHARRPTVIAALLIQPKNSNKLVFQRAGRSVRVHVATLTGRSGFFVREDQRQRVEDLSQLNKSIPMSNSNRIIKRK